MKSAALKSPVSVEIEIISRCNQRCEYCYNFWRRGDLPYPKEIIDSNNIKTVIDKLHQAEVCTVTFTGGEPLLRKDVLIEGIKYAHEKNMQVSVNSNSSLMTKEFALELKSLGVSGILSSLASSDIEENNSITNNTLTTSILQGFKNILDAGIHLEVNTTVYNRNKDHIYEIGKLLNSIGVDNMAISRFVPCFASTDLHFNFELVKEDVKSILGQLMRVEKDFNMKTYITIPFPLCTVPKSMVDYYLRASVRCAAGRHFVAISPEGDVRPCIQIPQTYGNILKEDFDVIWKRMNKFRDLKFVPQKCFKCKLFNYCGGGCRATSYAHGDMTGIDPLATLDIKNRRVPKKKLPRVKLSLETKIELIRPIKIRMENFGGLLVNLPYVVPINKDATRMLNFIMDKKKVFIKEIVSEFSLSKTDLGGLYDFIRFLLNSHKRIIKIAK